MNTQHLLKYHPSMDELTPKTQELIKKAGEAVKRFVEVSPKLSQTNYFTRGAHAKSYAYVKANFKANTELINALELQTYFKDNEDVLLRFSNANNVIQEESKDLPAYGISLKFDNNINYPLVNFPLFPTDDVDSFLELFIDLNEARIAQAQEGWGAVKELPSLMSSAVKAMFHINPLNVGNVIWKGIQMDKDFLFNYAFHGIGCYRFGKYVGKLHTEKLNFEHTNPEDSQKETLQNILNQEDISFKLYVQLGVDLEKTPVNILSKEWNTDNAPWMVLGEITIPKQQVMVNNDAWEKASFNPFLNPKALWPVGRIQQTRKQVYEISYKTRTKEG